MRLLEVGIKNFKSLRDVTFRPGDLNVLIGPNGAGKSNLADALDFIGEIYRFDLRQAVTGRGGYENICYRRRKNAKSLVALRIVAYLSEQDVIDIRQRSTLDSAVTAIIVEHSITIGPDMSNIGTSFRVAGEEFSLRIPDQEDSQPRSILRIVRDDASGIQVKLPQEILSAEPLQLGDLKISIVDLVNNIVGPSESMLSTVVGFMLPSTPVTRLIGSIFTAQISVWRCRDDAPESPVPQLGRHGENLPAVIEYLKREHPQAFYAILDTLSTIMPTLDDIGVFTTSQGLLALAFKETGFSRPWTINRVSDGTVRILGLMTALFDPTSRVIVIEEPENSLHPWAIGQFAEACRQASKAKQILITTHSPILIDQFRPENIWIVSKQHGQTRVDRLEDLDPNARVGWEEGDFTLSQYLDTGIVREAVPVIPL